LTVTVRDPFDAIFCRNVMIYFDAPTRAALVERFHGAIVPGGYLFVGAAESIAGGSRFTQIAPSVYQRGA
jgi:chemotaxis protein methyltransferase CheR